MTQVRSNEGLSADHYHCRLGAAPLRLCQLLNEQQISSCRGPIWNRRPASRVCPGSLQTPELACRLIAKGDRVQQTDEVLAAVEPLEFQFL